MLWLELRDGTKRIRIVLKKQDVSIFNPVGYFLSLRKARYNRKNGELSVDRAQKEATVEKLHETFKETESIVVTQYSGMTVSQVTA
ncbi:MAG: 50S ribosomal protein L10, partial [Alphaproteobacteria bacterium]|nr:50S ribosomal protein L10 [Alphaproteobacteria bacterium]